MKTIILCLCVLISTVVTAQINTNDSTKDAVKDKEKISCHVSDIWKVIQNRRSVRKFKPDSIPKKDILKIIEAARMAPTAGNQQPWKFIVVSDKKLINEMKDSCLKRSLERYYKKEKNAEKREQFERDVRIGLDGYFSAPVYIVILTDNNSTYPTYNHWDGPLAAGNLLLAARALGYGTVFITDSIPVDVTKAVLKIPENYKRVCITPLGIPYEWPAAPPKKKLEELIVWDKF